MRVCLGEKHGECEAGPRDVPEEDLAMDAVEIPSHRKRLRGENLNLRAGHVESQDFDSHATCIGRVWEQANDPVFMDQDFLGLLRDVCLNYCDSAAFGVV